MAKAYSKRSGKSSVAVKAPKLGKAVSSKPPSPLMSLSGKKDYRKQAAQPPAGIANFGLTGLTGET